jgi:adenylylsulfate kinase-like enzyme
MENTCQPVIAEIVQWINGGSDHPICWLNGPAGSGKSAIAQTVAELCSRHNRLGVGFFFLRGAGRRSDFTHFLSTLAYQLTGVLPSAEAYIRNVLQTDLFIGH